MAVASAERTIVGAFRSMDDAQRTFDALQKEGFLRDEISFVANKNAREARRASDATTEIGDTASDIAADAGIGAALGGVGGLLLSFAGLAVPGIGPVLAAGPILAALGGAGIGAAAGGLIGALTESGIPYEHGENYAESVRRGGILVTVRADEVRADRAAEVMDDNGAIDIDSRVSEWRERGWEWHDTTAEPLSSDELKRERDYYRAANEQRDQSSEQARRNAGPGSGSVPSAQGRSSAGAEARNARKDAARCSTDFGHPPPPGTGRADLQRAWRDTKRGAARIYDRVTK